MEVFKALSEIIDLSQNPIYYLSTNIVPLHRQTVIENIQRDDLVKQSIFSRQHYEKYHQDNFIKEQLAKPAVLMQGVAPNPLPVFNRDELQSALDICQAVKQKKHEDNSWRKS